jgi:competence protein ComEA
MSVEKIRSLLSAGLGERPPATRHARPPAVPIGVADRGMIDGFVADPASGAPRRSRWRVPIGATIVIVLVALAGAVAVSALAPHGSTASIGATTTGTDGSEARPAADGAGDADGAGGMEGLTGGGVPIFVHILGAVRSPGLYELQDGDRAVDAVAAAGGFGPEADLTQLNLARFVSDGEQIVVPIVGASPPATATGLTPAGTVNINTADATTLETLPRVGPAMSARIIAWRDQNGRFSVIEDLMNVSGVGEKTFDSLKELISV